MAEAHAPLSAPIAALPGEPSAHVQALIADFAALLAARGARIAGVTQTRRLDARTGRSRIMLRDIADGAFYAISQDLGAGSVACNLDSSELALACASIERRIAEGAELVAISKFSKQEAARGGLSDAFRAAILAKVPVVTAVSPHYLDEWREFAGPLGQFLEPSLDALEGWWARVRPLIGTAAHTSARPASIER